MPPKQKFTRDEIISAALDIIRKNGMDGLTARNLAKSLGSSARPVFTVFHNMEEVQQETRERAKILYNEYVERGLSSPIAFKGVGEQYIQFASDEPMLFQLLFMNNQSSIPNLTNVLGLIDNNYHKILDSIKDAYHLNEKKSAGIYQKLWIFTHGIATLIATGICGFTSEEISRMMSEVFIGLLTMIMKEDNSAIMLQHGGKDD